MQPGSSGHASPLSTSWTKTYCIYPRYCSRNSSEAWKTKESVDSNQATFSQNQFCGFFKALFRGTGSENHLQNDLITRNDGDGVYGAVGPQKVKIWWTGWIYLLCSYCYNNSKKDNHFFFYNFLDGKSPEKYLLRKKWINAVSRKDFKHTTGH